MIVGLTGNIGSGKSIVAKIFSILGVPVYNADSNAKKFLDNIEIKSLIKIHFGEKVFDNNNGIDTKALADIVFNDSTQLNKLNSIIHPFVINDFNIWVQSHLSMNPDSIGKQRTTDYVIIEAAILFESGYNSVADKIIVVTCHEELRIKRIMERDSMTEAEVKLRMKNQWNEEQKIKYADFIIINEEFQLITPQVIEINKQLKDFN